MTGEQKVQLMKDWEYAKEQQLLKKDVETNRGWNIISSVDDLPKEFKAYMVYSKTRQIFETRWLDLTGDKKAIKAEQEFWMTHYTHWREIVEIKPPIY